MSTNNPTILVVEDESSIASFVSLYLKNAGYAVRTAATGAEALSEAAAFAPALIVLDLMLPDIDGIEVCKRLRGDPATQSIAVLMITALDQPSDIERAVDAGTEDFLTKPINKNELLHRIRALLEARRNPRELERALAYFEAVQRPQ